MRGLLQHRDRLGALADAAQRLGVVDGRLGIARIGAVALAPGLHRLARIAARRRRCDGAGRRRHRLLERAAAGAGGRQQQRNR